MRLVWDEETMGNVICATDEDETNEEVGETKTTTKNEGKNCLLLTLHRIRFIVGILFALTDMGRYRCQAGDLQLPI